VTSATFGIGMLLLLTVYEVGKLTKIRVYDNINTFILP